MKKYLLKQLWMLAILLFAGTGSVFSYTITTTFSGIPYGSGGVAYGINNPREDQWVAESGDQKSVGTEDYVYLKARSLNPAYAIKKVEIDDEDITDAYKAAYAANSYYELGVLTKNITVNVEFEKVAETKNVTVTWNTDVLPDLNYHFEKVQGDWIFASAGEPCELIDGKTYSLWFEMPLGYYIASIKVDGVEKINSFSPSGGNGGFVDIEVSNNHNIVVEVTKSDIKTITVNCDDKVAYVDIEEIVYRDGRTHRTSISPSSSGTVWTWNLTTTKNYRMRIWLKNTQVYSIASIKVGGTDVTSAYNERGCYDFSDFSKDQIVDVEFNKKDSKSVTVTWEDWKASVQFYVPSEGDPSEGDRLEVRSDVATELLAGSTSRMMIYPYPGYKVKTLTVDDSEVTDYNGSYYEFANISADHTASIEFEEAQTYTITPTFDEEAISCDLVCQERWYRPSSGEAYPYNEGSKVKMVIPYSREYKVTVSIDGGTPFTPERGNDGDGDYEYVFDEGSLSANHTVAIEKVAKPTHSITATWDYSEVVVEVSEKNQWDSQSLVSGTACELVERANYSLNIWNPNSSIYTITSILVDGVEKLSDYEEDGVIEFENLSEDHNVVIAITKVASNTITVNYDFEAAHVEIDKFVQEPGGGETSDWMQPKDSGKEWELPAGNNYRVFIYPINTLLYSISSVKVGGTDVTATYNDKGYYEFENLSKDQIVDVEFNKAETKKVTVTWDTGEADVRFYYPKEGHSTRAKSGVATELLAGSTTQMMIYSYPGYKVKTLTVDESVVTDYNGSYYEFANISADHTASIEFETAHTFTITPTFNEEAISCNLVCQESWSWPSSGKAYPYNEGSKVKMVIPYYEEYKVTMSIDGGTPFTPERGNGGRGDYEYVFDEGSLSDNHTVTVTTEKITFHTITVNFDDKAADAELNGNWVYTGESEKFAEGSDVKLVLDIYTGWKLNDLKIGDTDVTDDYLANGYYTIGNLSGDVVVNVTFEKVDTRDIDVYFAEYSQGKIYLGADYERNSGTFNVGSDVTMVIKPSIGYEVISIILKNWDTDEETEVINNFVDNKYVFTNLSADYSVRITTQKKSMAGVDPVVYTLSDLGQGTYCSEYDLDFTDVEGITAYIASGFNPLTGSVVLTKVEQVPAGTGLVIKGTPGDYTIPVKATNYYYMNMLKGIVEPTLVETYERSDKMNADCANYTLQDDLIFHLSNGAGKLSANKAYLQIPRNLVQPSMSRIHVVWDEDATAIKGILQSGSDDTEGGYYNLNGQKVLTPKKGIYVKNGKKIMIH